MRNGTDALRSLQVYVSAALGEEWEVRWDGDQVKLPFARVRRVGRTLYQGGGSTMKCVQPMAVTCYPKPEDLPNAEQAELWALAVEEKLVQAFKIGVAPLPDPTVEPVVEVDSDGDLVGEVSYRYTHADRWGGETLPSPASDPVTVNGMATVTMPDFGFAYRVYRSVDGSPYELVRRDHPTDVWVDTGVPPNPNGVPPITNVTAAGAPNRVPLYDCDGLGLYEEITHERRAYCDFMRVTDFSVDPVRDPDDERRVIVACDVRLEWLRAGRGQAPGETLQRITATGTGT